MEKKGIKEKLGSMFMKTILIPLVSLVAPTGAHTSLLPLPQKYHFLQNSP